MKIDSWPLVRRVADQELMQARRCGGSVPLVEPGQEVRAAIVVKVGLTSGVSSV
jgi:hypothetical protein